MPDACTMHTVVLTGPLTLLRQRHHSVPAQCPIGCMVSAPLCTPHHLQPPCALSPTADAAAKHLRHRCHLPQHLRPRRTTHAELHKHIFAGA
jgi:hypothetical protein